MRLELVGFEPTSTKVFKLLFYPDNVLHINLNLIFKKTLHKFLRKYVPLNSIDKFNK